MSMCQPHSPTRITKNSTLKLPGLLHWPKTSRMRSWAFSYSMGEPCGRSNQLITYFIAVLSEPGDVLRGLPFEWANDLALQRFTARKPGSAARITIRLVWKESEPLPE